MLRKIIFLLFGVIVGLPFDTVGQDDRYATWIHGYNGNDVAWAGFRNDFNRSHRINAEPPNYYGTTNGVQAFADLIVQTNHNALFTHNNYRHITIAHSFGGVAARRIDLQQTRNLGGLITVGSPLSGAGIAYSINSGQAAAEVDNGIHQVSRGPLTQWLPIVRVLNLDITAIINFFTDNAIFNATKPDLSTIDLQRGSPKITNDMDAVATNLPKISIYGNEEAPVSWNLMSSTTGLDLTTAAENAEDIYYGFYITNNVSGVLFIAGGFWNPWGWAASALSFWRAAEWRAGYDWIHDFDRVWNVLIGSNISNNQCFQVQAYICYYPSTSSSCWQTRTYCVNAQLNGQSDGFIPAVSQAGYGSRSWAGVPLVEALGVNHTEEHEPSNATMKQKFDEIFNGAHGGYFQTDSR